MPLSPVETAAPELLVSPWVRQPPATARGARTRARLVAAARTVFERDGYLDARLADISREAGCSTGTFYIYFTSKEEAFHAVLESVQDDMLHPGFGHHVDPATSPFELIRLSNRAYLEAYQRNAMLMMLLEQAATVEPRFREIRSARARAFAERNGRSIARLQAAGLADPTLDPSLTARSLSAMVSRTAYFSFCIDEEQPSMDALVDNLTTLWANAIGVPRHSRST